MGKTVTAKDLNLDDDYEEEDTGRVADPEEDSSETAFKGGPMAGEIGAEAVEREIDEKKRLQKESEEKALADRLGEEKGEDKGKKFQYRDQEAAEKAVRDAKRKITELSTNSKKIEAINADLQKRVDEVSGASPVVAPPGENPYDLKRQQIADDTLSKANAVPVPQPPQDREDPEYDKKWGEYQKQMAEYNSKVARVWADAQGKISKVTLEEEYVALQQKETINASIQTALEEEELSNGVKLSDVKNVMQEFWKNAANVQKGISFEDQVKRAVAATKEYYEDIIQTERSRFTKDRKEKETFDVLGSGSRRITTKKEPEYSRTLGEAKAASMDRKRLRFNP